MAEHNWRELLDDPEVRSIISRIARTTPPTGDSYLDDDRESYLWDKAVSLAIKHEDRADSLDHRRLWYGHLNARLRHAVHQQRSDVYGRKDVAHAPWEAVRRHAESSRVSLEALTEDYEDAWIPLYADTLIDDGYTRERWPDAPGHHVPYPGDPLTFLLRKERLEEALAHSPSHTRDTRLCADTSCNQIANPRCRGFCSKHYEHWRSRWGTGATCTHDGCDRPVKARDLCLTHYQALRRNNPDAPRCSDPGCDRSAFTQGMCARHYNAAHRARVAARA
ncbi:hypothetical protein [Cellulomonas uda]|uniref:A20-type domain-containing protein n=1 Tax=Cellulomonas uda TaxID=1714 RepID=A0A4Y3KA98_CELUD|nr:hypothetical protein [Cellulomonas uda]NII65568.1 hypothetical protein [Cellulomonas uda]GEA81399.1 hypothetical protein CUD01_18430 [Cellulomonas uda]